MAKGYDLTVQINLRGPANLNNVANNINKKLSNIQANVKVKVPPNVARQLNALNRNMKGIQKSANTATSSMEKFGKSAGLAIRRFGAFTAATAGFYAITRATTQALEKFIEFDRQITRIAQVTGSTRQALSGLGDEITSLSTSLGVSSQELAQVSVVLSQAGLSAQATERALKALALTTLAPTFNDINQTVEGSIALMKQFSITTNQLEGALGSINAVAGQFAVEANDIITAIQRTGGVFAAASNGVSQGTDALNEFIAVFTSVRATTRESAETIATGLRTIFTRIQREDTLDALKAFGIELTDLEGKFVGPFRAIERLSAGLRTLDPRDVKFSSLVEELGGFRQVGKVIPLIQQFATAQNALNVAQQGSSSLAKDAALGQQSLGVQIAKVGEEFNALIRSIGQTGEFKQFISLSLDLASALIKIADAVKPVIPALAALGTIAVGKNIGTFAKGFKGGIGFNQGGMVRGQKGVDKIQTRLTDGEYVIQQPAVKSIGANVLEHINKTGELPGFRKGGPVQAADLASSLVRRRVTRTGKPSEYKSGQRINATDNIEFEVIEQAINSNKNIGNKAFETKTAQQLGGTTSTSGIAAVDVMVGSGKNAMPVEARNRKSFTSDAELADKLIRQRYAELGDAAFTNRSDPDTISLGAITVAYNAGKLSAAKQKALTERGGTVQQRKKPARNKGGYGDPNEFEALVTDGEFIIQESAARRLGPQTLKELNNAHKKGLPKFHTGGMVRRFNKGSPGNSTGGGSSGGGGFGGIGAILAIQGAATTFASLVESAGTKFASSTAGALQGLAGGVSAGFVGRELGGVLGLGKMAGPVGAAIGAFVGFTGAVNGAINAARKFETELNNEKIKNATDTVSSALERLGKDAKDFGAIRDIESGIQRATQGILDNRRIEREVPKAFLGNFIETLAGFGGRSEEGNMVAAQRALILETQGLTAYIRSVDTSARTEMFEPIRQQQAEAEARSFKPVADAAIRLFEEQIRGGANIGEIINADQFKQFSDALARSNPIIAQRISAIRADTSITKEARQAKINDLVAQEAATQARVRTSALRAQLEIDAAQKTGKTLERVLNRIFENINQTLNAVTSGIKTVFDNIDIEIAAASGQSKIVFDDQKLITVLENQQAFSSNEVDAAINRFTPLLGDQGNTIGNIAKASSRLEGDILAAINKAIKDPDNTTDESVAAAVRKEIQGIVANLNLPPDVANILSRQISAGIDGLRSKGKDKIGLDTSDVRESIQGFGETIDSFKGANNVILNTAKTYNSALQRYTNVQNRLTESRVQRDQLLRNSIDILRSGAENLAKAFGRTASLSEVAAGVRDRTVRQTGGPDDPQQILQNVERLQNRRRALQGQRDSASQDPNRFEQLQFFDDKLIDTNAALKNNIDALQAMASNTDVANAALSRIAQVQQQRQAQGGFLEQLVSSTPEEVNALNSAFGTIQRTLAGQDTTIQNSVNAQRAYIETLNETGNVFAAQQAAQGGLAEDRGAAIGLAKELAAFLPEGQGNEIRADLLQQFLRQTGNLTPRFQQVVDAMRNPEQDPETAEAKQYYARSIQQQSDASRALATIQANLEKQIQASSASAVASALQAVTLNVRVLNTSDIARGVQPPPRGRGQQNRAQGGIIYASEGQSISFQPKGTDTVPAMLTPGEFVVNRKAASRNMGMLQNINSGKANYYQDGGVVGPYSSRRLKSEESMSANKFLELKEWNKLVGQDRQYFTSTRISHPPSTSSPLSYEDMIKNGDSIDNIKSEIRKAFFSSASSLLRPGFSQNLEVIGGGQGGAKKRFEDSMDTTVDDFRKSLSGPSASGASIIPSAAGPYVSPSQIDSAVASSQRRRTLLATASQKTGLSLPIIEDLLKGKTSDVNIFHNKSVQGGDDVFKELGNLALYSYNHSERSPVRAFEEEVSIPLSKMKEYKIGFAALTNHVRRSPANSPLHNITGLNKVNRSINARALSFQNPERGHFGLFEGPLNTNDIGGLGVDQNKTIGKGLSGLSVDEGKFIAGPDILANDDGSLLSRSQEIYDQVINHRKLLQQRQTGALTPEALGLIKKLDQLVVGRQVFSDLTNFDKFFQSPTNPMYGLSRRGKRIYDRNNQSEDFRLNRRGGRVTLGLSDNPNVPDVLKFEQEAVDKKVADSLRRTQAVEQSFDFLIPNRNRQDPRQPNRFKLSIPAFFTKYQGVFADDAAENKYLSQTIAGIQDRVTGLRQPILIPSSGRNSLFSDEQVKGWLNNPGGTFDAFAYNLGTYRNQVARGLSNNENTVNALLGMDGQDRGSIDTMLGVGRAHGATANPNFYNMVTGGGGAIYDIYDAVKNAASRSRGREVDLEGLVPSEDTGGRGILAKFNDMLSDSKAFWGRNTGIASIAEAQTTQEAITSAQNISQGFMNIPGNHPAINAWARGFSEAFSNIGGTLIDRYTSGGNVQTTRFAHDLAMARSGEALNPDGEAYVKKIFDAGFADLNAGAVIPATLGGAHELFMNPQNIFPKGNLRSSGIVKLFKSLIDNEFYGDAGYKGLPSKSQAGTASRILARWYGGYQDQVVAPIKTAREADKPALWQQAVRNYPGADRRVTNLAHNLLGGAPYGPILSLAGIGTLSQAPIGLSNGGVVYASNGMQVPESLKQGTDTVPAMLTPGEFVVNAKAAKKHKSLLHQINSGGKPSVKNGISYANDGGEIEAYMQMQFQKYAIMFHRQWVMSQGLGNMNVPMPIALRAQARMLAIRDGQRMYQHQMMTEGHGFGVLKRPGDDENRQSFLDKRRAMRNRSMGLNDDGSRKKVNISKDQYLANTRRPQGEEETPQPGVIASLPAKEETPKPVTQSTSATSSKKPYTMPERGAGVSMVVGAVPAKEEDPFAEMKRQRAETQAELAKITSVDGKVKYLQDMWKKEGLNLSRERALAMLELQDPHGTPSSPSKGALLQRGQFDEGTTGPTESEKSKPGINGFMKQLQEKQARDAEKNIIKPGEQAPLKGSNTTISSKTEFKDLETFLEGMKESGQAYAGGLANNLIPALIGAAAGTAVGGPGGTVFGFGVGLAGYDIQDRLLEGTELGKLRDELRELDPTGFAMGELTDPALVASLAKKIIDIPAKRLSSANKLLGDLNLGEKILGPSDGVRKISGSSKAGTTIVDASPGSMIDAPGVSSSKTFQGSFQPQPKPKVRPGDESIADFLLQGQEPTPIRPNETIKPQVRPQGIEPPASRGGDFSKVTPEVTPDGITFKEPSLGPRDVEGNLTKPGGLFRPTDDPKLRKIQQEGMKEEFELYNKRLEQEYMQTPRRERFGEQTAQAAAPTLSYKKRYEQFLERTGQKAKITDPKQMKLFMDAMERKTKLPEVEEGFTRLYRYGETADNFKQPFGADKPAYMQSNPDFKLKKDSAGKFFTDKFDELDFYVGEGDTPQPFKYTDIPTDKLDQFSVASGGGQQKFGSLSGNKNAEFVLSDAEIKKALNFNRGGSVLVDYAPQGTDTVPAMLTPGEFVVNREATKKNLGLLKAMNKSRGGKVNNGILYAMNGLDDPVGLSSFTMPSMPSSSSGSGGGVDFSPFSAAVTTFELAVGSFAAAATLAPTATSSPAPTAPTIDLAPLTQFGTQIASLVNKDFSVIRVGAEMFGSSVSALNVPVTNFSRAVGTFANLLNQTNSLVSAITAVGNINARIEVQGSIQMPTEITVNVEGLGAGAGGAADTANLESSIMNSVADALQTQMPGINVDGIRNQVNGTGEQQA